MSNAKPTSRWKELPPSLLFRRWTRTLGDLTLTLSNGFSWTLVVRRGSDAAPLWEGGFVGGSLEAAQREAVAIAKRAAK